jgi:hypothetical protein
VTGSGWRVTGSAWWVAGGGSSRNSHVEHIE